MTSDNHTSDADASSLLNAVTLVLKANEQVHYWSIPQRKYEPPYDLRFIRDKRDEARVTLEDALVVLQIACEDHQQTLATLPTYDELVDALRTALEYVPFLSLSDDEHLLYVGACAVLARVETARLDAATAQPHDEEDA